MSMRGAVTFDIWICSVAVHPHLLSAMATSAVSSQILHQLLSSLQYLHEIRLKYRPRVYGGNPTNRHKMLATKRLVPR